MAVGDNDEPQRPDPLASSGTPTGANSRQTRNVTVTIQYAVLNGGRQNGGDDNDETVSRVPFVLNFTDVPPSATQERLEQVVALASNLAINRLHTRFNRPKGITKEAFEKLPVLGLDKVPQETCSICYDSFEEEVLREEESRESRKRTLDSEGDISLDATKRQRTPSEAPSQPSYVERDHQEGTSQNSNHSDSDVKNVPSVKYKHSPVQLPCGHIFGRDCIREWTLEHNTCPVCRRPIVDASGLNSPPPNEDEDSFLDQQTLERIRLLLYGPLATGANDTNRPGHDPAPPAQSPLSAAEGAGTNFSPRAEPMNALANFIVFRPNRSPTTNDMETNHGSPQAPPIPNGTSAPANAGRSPPLILNGARPGGIGLMPITFIHLRGRSPTRPQNAPEEAMSVTSGSTDTGVPHPDNAASQVPPITTDTSPETNSFISSLNHIFNMNNNESATPSTEPQRDTTAESASSTNNDRNEVEPHNAQPSGNTTTTTTTTAGGQGPERRRGFNLNSLLGLARNFSTFNHRRNDSDQLFSTGVASRRTPDGVSTVNFNGQMPNPESQEQGQGQESSHQQHDDVQDSPASHRAENSSR
ncbi:ubiquitin-protein ligase SAN1 LALA0_S07e05006g [Lachancea lanzarotensis]|uniref:LALA0S07e05006g1_1 n=1 Tax=Lachancea lanzarotensis TaxID=1245769 RepID=A0A0C7N5J3_9SACH|nr:uncharacterized protein LALA0_S07e05006g [Lachancea lanzarotensis]CEP63213.1 LALA0S07e05006g1_1 [Lachancea lanzarotensis]